MRHRGSSCRYVRLVTNPYFCFFLYENCNVGLAIVDVSVVETFSFNASLAIFAFSIVNTGVVAVGISGLSHIPVFAFLLIKIVT